MKPHQTTVDPEPEQETWRALAAKRQREKRSLTTQLSRYRERERWLLARLRDAQQANQALEEEKEFLERDARELRHWLNEVYTSRLWKLASVYYRLVTETPLRYPYDFIKMWRRYGLRYSLRTAGQLLESPLIRTNREGVEHEPAKQALRELIHCVNGRKYRAIYVVTSAFAFDEMLNQRAIKLSTSLAAKGLGVIYVAWRWSKHDLNIPVGQEVSKNIFQVPVDAFLSHHECFRSLDCEAKSFVAQFPYPAFLKSGIALKEYGFGTLYEIVDNWAEFHKANQAPWYAPEVEDAIVLNFDLITAVSEPLREKFSSLRADIEVVPNGYDPEALGIQGHNIARPFSRDAELNIGYFGHLTDAWFDWSLIFEILDLASREHIELKFHIIGFGEPRYIRNRIKAHRSEIELYGRIPTSKLYQYAAEWDVGIVPFKKGKLGESADPIKVYEYLYFGMPVLVAGISHLSCVPGIYHFETASEFLELIRTMKERLQQSNPEAIRQFLQNSTWNHRFPRVMSLIENRPTWKCL